MAAVANLPSRLLLQPMRFGMAAAQGQLRDAQIEASSGRHADMAVTLGSGTGNDVALRLQLAGTSNDLNRAEQAKIMASALQESLSTLSELAGQFRSTLTGARSNTNARSIAVAAATSALASMQATLNTNFEGQYLFGGLNSETPPMNDYANGPRQAILSAFTAEFGFPPDDPAAAALTPSQVTSFLSGRFDDLFKATAWAPTWSNAADETPVTRLGHGEEINTAATANQPFAKKLAAAFSLIEVLGKGALSRSALEAGIDTSLSLVSEGQLAVGDEQTRIGMGESRLASATLSLKAREVHFTSAIEGFEGVDSYEAATRVNVLMSQLEASYALTARISKMSLLSYI